MSALVQLVGVSKTFGDAAAVHAIDLLVERGKTTVLIGPSGCGKSTLLSLIRALMLSPELLLLDEPLGALDPLVRAALQQDLKEIFARLRQTALLVTHDLAEAAYLGDEIVLVNEGRIVQQGSLADLREKPASSFVSEFINAQRSLAVL